MSAGKLLQIIETPPHTIPHPLVLVVKFGTHLAALIKAIAVQILIIKSSPDPSQKQSNYMLFTILWYAFAFYLPNLLTTPRRDLGDPDNCFNFLHVGPRAQLKMSNRPGFLSVLGHWLNELEPTFLRPEHIYYFGRGCRGLSFSRSFALDLVLRLIPVSFFYDILKQIFELAL